MAEKRSLLPVFFIPWAGFATVSMTVLVPMGLPKMAWMMLILFPGLLIHLGLFVYAARRDQALWNRLVTGLWVGVVGTMALDVVRLIGVKIGVFGDMPSMFGAMILTQKPVGQFMMEMISGKMQPDFSMMGAMVAGYLYHYLNGIGITTVFTVLFGGLRPVAGFWYGGVFVELLMMISPPVVMMSGPFGFNTGPWVLIVTFIAHVVYGLVIGKLGHKFIQPGGLFWKLSASGSPPMQSAAVKV